ncbi:MAG: Asp-tRNA(Asn)/Glu-tRNA(Gln) amidotransferase subunit GatA [Deltaproteobacteria bacterium]|nr:Asp-tRNA(Asn)/Glu-tRNA(Gln) amidotransferase subunit GatA [Candidatus Zymogenaceae bacterium]
MDICSSTIHELATAYRNGDTDPVAATETFLERIERINPSLNAYIRITADTALARAKEAKKRLVNNDATTLTGIPLGIKDLMCTRGITTTCGSKILEHFVPPYNATVIERLAGQGAVMLGKTNMDEFAMGSSTESSYFGPTRNPHNTDYIPGGSSGGSAAAVAADLCCAALGSDTGGSIRQPASYTGIVGLKPTYGLVSRYGLVAFASSLDQIGPMTKDVRDAAILFSAIAGHDKRDSTSLEVDIPDYTEFLDRGVQGLRVGVPKEYFGEGLDEEVEGRVMEMVKTLEGGGAKIIDVSIPRTEHALAAYYIIAPSEASSNLARYDGVRYGFRDTRPKDSLIDMFRRSRSGGFGPEVKRRIMLGTYALSAGYYDAYYKKALQVRRLLSDDLEAAFAKVDVIACPAAPTPAYKIGEKLEDPLSMYLGDVYTVTANLAGIPGMSVPAGLNSQGLPIGVQLLAKPLGEEHIFRSAYYLEQNRPHHTPKPSL